MKRFCFLGSYLLICLFCTITADQPLIVQFAAHNSTDFATAAELVAR
jgi:hypothetical protein